VAAIMLGLRHRDQTGQGCWVGTSLYANGAWANGTTLAGVAIGAKMVTREPPDRPRNALTNLYRTRDERWLQLLVVRDDRLWVKSVVVEYRHVDPLPHLRRILAVLSRRTRQILDASRALRWHDRLGRGTGLGDCQPELVVAARRARVRLRPGLVRAFLHREE